MAAIIPEKGVKGDQDYLLQQHSPPKHVTIAGVGHWTSGDLHLPPGLFERS